MDAGYRIGFRFISSATIALACLFATSEAADYRTQNFIVMASTPALAKAVGEAAEGYRHDLAEHWLGQSLPPWPTPCPIRVISGNMPAQGMTQYNRSPVRDFQMEVVGTPERILDSVLPHEVTHTILASHFGRPLPRWADEGICTTVEHASERQKHEEKLREFLRTRRGIAMNKLFLLTEYPNDVLPMYAQGYSVCQFLIAQRGPQQFVQFLGDYMQRPSWTENVRRHYGYESLGELQEKWLAWVSVGNGPVDRFAKINLQNQSLGANSDPGVSLAAATTTADTPQEHELLASSEPADGWYSRLRREALPAGARPEFARPEFARPEFARPEAAHPGRTRTADPPSVYSAAQPQPEQGVRPTGQPAYWR